MDKSFGKSIKQQTDQFLKGSLVKDFMKVGKTSEFVSTSKQLQDFRRRVEDEMDNVSRRSPEGSIRNHRLEVERLASASQVQTVSPAKLVLDKLTMDSAHRGYAD